VSQDLEFLIALHETDLKLNEHRAKTQHFAKERARIEAEYQAFAKAYNDAVANLEAAQTNCRELQQELEDTNLNHEKYKQDLQKVRNQKEYETVLREIDLTKKNATQLETRILEAMEEVKKYEAEVASYAPDIENRRTEADTALAASQRDEEAYEATVAGIRAQRGEVEGRLSKQWLNSYNRIAKQKSGQVMAEVVNGACSACRMRLRPHVYSQIRQNQGIHNCDNCGRILYYRAEKPEEEAAQAAG
jgi:uncharacterized protein